MVRNGNSQSTVACRPAVCDQPPCFGSLNEKNAIDPANRETP
jgi:hypothetical protein